MLIPLGALTLNVELVQAQQVEPARFQRPANYRYLLGVRKSQANAYGSGRQTTAALPGHSSPSRAAADPRAYGGQPGYSRDDDRGYGNGGYQADPYQDDQVGEQPIGTGVRRQSMSSPSLRSQAIRNQAARSQPRVDPIHDPFGDYDAAPVRRVSNQQVAGGTFRSPQVRQATRTTALNSPQQQDSILQQPANSRDDGFSAPGNFSLEPQDPDDLTSPVQDDPSIQESLPVDPSGQIPPPGDRPRLPRQDSFRQQRFELDCDEISGVMLQKSISQITLNMRPEVEPGRVIPQECDFGDNPVYPRCWTPQTFNFTASAACSKPLYFQDIQLERYGHTRGPIIEPILSAAHFFGNVAIYPYKAGIHPPNECMYALGYYRPGDCAPWLREPWPWSVRGAAFQALSTVGYTGVFR